MTRRKSVQIHARAVVTLNAAEGRIEAEAQYRSDGRHLIALTADYVIPKGTRLLVDPRDVDRIG